MKIKNTFSCAFTFALFTMCFSPKLLAQGQDSTTAERDIMILGELLPGYFSNANQSYFDYRLKVDEQEKHQSISWDLSRIQASKLGDMVFALEVQDSESDQDQHALLSFIVDDVENAVRMKTYRLNNKFEVGSIANKTPSYLEGCDLLWTQEAGQFRGRAASSTCEQKINVARDIMFSPDGLWVSHQLQDSRKAADHYAMDRARLFECYADLPGVGGGRDIPFERYTVKNIHDLGGEKWFTTKEGQEVGINLFRVMWTFNNYDGVFTRPSFVVYVKTKEEKNAKPKEISYAWTEPTAQRIGINLKWMLVNCYMLSNEDVTPFYKMNEPKL